MIQLLLYDVITSSGVTGGGGGGGGVPPETSDWEIFADVLGKKRQGKKSEKGWRGENWEEKKENSYKKR